MPANIKDFVHLRIQTQLLPEQPSWSEIGAVATKWRDFLATIALPHDNPVSVIRNPFQDRNPLASGHSPTLRQLRYRHYTQMTEIAGLAMAASRGQRNLDARMRTKTFDRLLGMIDDIGRMAEHDVDPVSYTRLRESGYGRNKFDDIRRLNSAGKVSLDEYKRQVRRVYQHLIPEYLLHCFPSVTRKEDVPEINLRTALMIASDLHESIADTKPHEAGEILSKIFQNAEQNNCFKLPEEPGIRKPSYWADVIRNRFSDTDRAPNYDHLLPFIVQDRITSSEIVMTLMEQGAWKMAPEEVELYHLNGNANDIQEIISFSEGTQNRVLVMEDQLNGDPLLVQNAGHGLQNTIRVVKPGFQEMVTTIFYSDTDSLDRSTRTKCLESSVFSAVAQTTRMTESGADVATLQSLEEEWLAMFKNNFLVTDSAIKRFQKRVAQAAEHLIAPALHSFAIDRESQQEKLHQWLFLAQRCGLTLQPDVYVSFGLPRKFGTVHGSASPKAEIVLEDHETARVYKLDSEGARKDSVLVTANGNLTQKALEAALKMGATTVGERHPSGFGMKIAKLSENGQFVDIGHWLAPDERTKLLELPLADVEKALAPDKADKRTSAEIIQLQEALLAMVYQPNTQDPLDSRNDLMIEAGYQWNTQGQLPIQAKDGHTVLVDVSREVLETQPLKEIRRHLCAQIILSDLNYYDKANCVQRIRSSALEDAYQDYLTVLDDVSLVAETPRLAVS
ncbi:hypothetical protein BTO32_15100 [Marinobacter lutaoensis]|uniref:Uncharacterized protein n=1 Tax=Marinobacter lutaoensis TaxID=135739 RepID=A0A1V2DPI2_9GAMM|nr:hypothetical protein [Marinobacter lutaoensis]ONF42535.1 hypothetical protein BTO32_15100 [Marinobacter lutaoensis]